MLWRPCPKRLRNGTPRWICCSTTPALRSAGPSRKSARPIFSGCSTSISGASSVCRARHTDDAPEIDVEQPLKIGLADFLEGPAERNAGVVEQQIHLGVPLRNRFGQGRHSILIAYIQKMQAQIDCAVLDKFTGL